MTKGKAPNTALTLPDLVVLSMLSEAPMHGYQLVTELENRDVKDWATISRPQIYYSLKKLAEKKFIRPLKNDPDPSLGPDRVKYTVNDNGEQALNEGLGRESWAIQRPPPPFLTWMALSSHLPKITRRTVINWRRRFLLEQLNRERKTLKEFDGGSDAMQTAGKLMVSFTVQSFELELKWLDEVERDFGAVK